MRRAEKQRLGTKGKNMAVNCCGEEDTDAKKKVNLFTEAVKPQRREHGDEARYQSGGEASEDCGDSGEEEESEGIGGEEEERYTGGGIELQTEEHIGKELSTMPFEDIMELQKKVGTKVFNEVAYNRKGAREVSKKKRLNKNRPMEISAKNSPSFLRQVIPVKKSTRRDPRFDSLSGEYKPIIFEKTYKFINDLKHREKEIIKKQLKKTKNSSQRKERLQSLLRRLENQEQARRRQEQQRERELKFKKQQRERANRGAQPFFLKKSEKKKLQLAEKYLELKKRGKLENFLSKKRKRNSFKDRKKLPEQLLN
ncbi:ribosomal RNA processing protein 36 homolog [Fundulus diaphanus]